MKIFHIRQKKPNHWKTLCGEPTTQHDDRFSWQALAVGDYVPCAKCVEIKAQLSKSKREGSTDE